jgi:hypothetical protein
MAAGHKVPQRAEDKSVLQQPLQRGGCQQRIGRIIFIIQKKACPLFGAIVETIFKSVRKGIRSGNFSREI